jgi:hypothetical protein
LYGSSCEADDELATTPVKRNAVMVRSFDHSKSLICCKDMAGNTKRGTMTKLSCFPVMGQMRHFGLLQSAD